MNVPIKSTLNVNELEVFVGKTKLLGPVSFSLGAGETLVIMGETGAGKSLVAQAILGTLPKELHYTGLIEINGQSVSQLSEAQREALWGRAIAALPQEPWLALDPLMHSQKQVIGTHAHVAGLPLKDAKKQADKDFKDLGLVGAEKLLPSQLSGGMAQRVAFAAATAGGTPILFADEPTKGLDRERAGKVAKLLKSVPQQHGILIAITHEALVAKELGGQVLVLKNGELIEQGLTQEVLQAPQHAYTKALLEADPINWEVCEKAAVGETDLTVNELAIERGGKTLIHDFNLELKAGERIAITGPSGIGKTSLLNVLAGLVKPKSGFVETAKMINKNGIQKLYQDPPTAFPPYVLLATGMNDVVKLYGADWREVFQNMDKLNLDQALLKRYPNQVSGGELQRMAIVRALITKPQILLCDEPTSRLDPITQKETLNMLGEITSERKIGLVLVTHDEMIAEKWAHKKISLSCFRDMC